MATTKLSKYLDCKFDSIGPSQQDDGTITSGTASETNRLTMGGLDWSQFIIGTQTTIVPALSQLGVDIVQTDTNGQGMVLCPYTNARVSPLAFKIGTDPAFFAELTVQVTDWSGARLMFGFHGGAAATATQVHKAVAAFGDYTDLALIGNYAGGAVDVYTQQCINDEAPTDTDTTINLTDGDVMKATVYVSAAGVVTYALSLAATATDTTFVSQTITTAAQTFDSTDVVVPMILLTNHTDTASAVILKRLRVGYQ